MSKSIEHIYIGMSELGLEIADRPDDAQLGKWLRELHRLIVRQQKGKDPYADKIIDQVAEQRQAWVDKRRSYKKKEEEDGPESPPCGDGGCGHEAESPQPSAVTDAAPFVPPTVEQVNAEFAGKGRPELAEAFFAYWQKLGWKRGRKPMKSLTLSVSTWIRNAGAKPVAPTPEEVTMYADELKFYNGFEKMQFLNHYAKRGWKGVVDWKAALREWINNYKQRNDA